MHYCNRSDRPKTVEQIGLELTNAFDRYNVVAKNVFEGNKEVRKNDWTLRCTAYLTRTLTKNKLQWNDRNHRTTHRYC